MKKLVLITGCLAVLFSACAKGGMEKIVVKGEKFATESGNTIVFKGLNIINKMPDQNYFPGITKELCKQFADDGINLIRYGIVWDGLEPKPGEYNEKYLEQIKKEVALLNSYGMYVYLDMHQDLYGIPFGGGAPAWATFDDGLPHYTGDVWSDAYIISPAEHAAWDNFWANKKASDQIGLQDHYANVWKWVAEAFKNDNGVIGYDLMNEPFVGSSAKNYLPIIFTAYAELYAAETEIQMSAEEVGSMWTDLERRTEALKFLDDTTKYSQVMGSAQPLVAEFESKKLQPFYEKLTTAIREISDDKIVFINHNYFSNPGIQSALQPLVVNGKVDTQVAYAAHAYDLMVDTEFHEKSSFNRLDFMFDQIYKTSKRLKMPVIIGEWGAFSRDGEAQNNIAQHQLNIFKKYGWSHSYWAFDHHFLPKSDVYKIIYEKN